MTTIADSLLHAEKVLASAGIGDPRREALSLTALAIESGKTFLYAHPEERLTTEQLRRLDSLLERRARREPLQYISGVQEFYGLDFVVTPDVLIPRPETEMVVERALSILRDVDAPVFCEIGIGSGCIAVAILHENRSATAVGVDVSSGALAVARHNAEKHGVADRLTLLQSDVFDSLTDERFNMIVSNPPYVPDDDIGGLQPEVRDFEPRFALTDGSDGLTIIKRIIDGAPGRLSSGGYLILEIGFNQSVHVRKMFDKNVWGMPHFFPDLQGIPRLVAARLI